MSNRDGGDTEMPAVDVSMSEVLEPRRAAMLGVIVVRQVLEEAFVIANAAKDSGQPWQYLAMLKSLPGRLSRSAEELTAVEASKEAQIMDEAKDERNLATSTPQRDIEENVKPKAESTFIGQGDQDFDVRNEDMNKSTSVFINELFDMSEVEKVATVVCDDDETDLTEHDMLTITMSKIMDSYVNAAFNIAFDQNPCSPQVLRLGRHEQSDETMQSAERSCLSFLQEALGGQLGRDMGFYNINDIEDDNPSTDEENVIQVLDEDDGNPPEITVEEIIDEETGVRDVIIIEEAVSENLEENQSVPDEISSDIVVLDEPLEGNVVVVEAEINEKLDENDVTLYGNMYSTLNRDYEQCSEEDEPVLQDPKETSVMQDIELMGAHTSEESLSSRPVPEEGEEKRELAATSNVSALSGKSKSSLSSLASRWKSQSARLLSCLRGWWRRRTPSKRREKLRRGPGSVRGLCPLSPDARRRAASLLDNHHLCSPQPSRSVVWKFNTINETVVNTARYKDYTFDKTEKVEEQREYLVKSSINTF